MKKSILKSLEPKTKTLFKYNNSNRAACLGAKNGGPATTTDVDPTTTTSATTTWII